MMKKAIRWICGTLLMAVMCVSVTPGRAVASAEGGATLPDFSEDFERYDTTKGFIENDPTFAEKWGNNVLKQEEEQLMDAHLRGVAKVEYESGNSGNKVLHLDNASVAMDSFFHIGPANDYRVKNFTAGFRLKFKTSEKERGWVGISFRKKAMSHYTGTNNLMFTVQRYTANATVSAPAYAVFDGGSTNTLGDPGMQSLFGDKLIYSSQDYTIPDAVGNQDTPWMDFRLEANGNTYTTYINDTVVAECTFNVPSFDYFGYLSLNCCTANVLVDDFYVTVQDTELPPAISNLPTPQVTFDEASKTLSWEKIDGANLYRVYVDGEAVKTSGKTQYTLEDGLSAGEHKIAVQAISEDLFLAKNSELSEEIVYTVKGTSDENADKGSGGCGSALSFGVLPMLVVAGAVVKRRKNKTA